MNDSAFLPNHKDKLTSGVFPGAPYAGHDRAILFLRGWLISGRGVAYNNHNTGDWGRADDSSAGQGQGGRGVCEEIEVLYICIVQS